MPIRSLGTCKEKTITKLKQEFEELVNNSSAFERGLIINNFSFSIPKELENLIYNAYECIYGFSFYLFLPLSDNEYGCFSVSHSLKEPIKEEDIRKVFEINSTSNRHPHLVFEDLNEPFVVVLFILHPVPENFFENLKECSKYLVDVNRVLNFVALVRLSIKDFKIDFDYYWEVL
jgi:hypothetical protein